MRRPWGCYGSLFINEGRMAMSVEKLVEHFSALEDPRCAGKVDHRLIDILVIAVCAVIACAERTLRSMAATSWAGVPELGQRHSLARHFPEGLHADRSGRLRGLLQRLGAVLCRGLRPGSRGDRWQDPAPLLRPRPGAGATAPGQRLGQRARPVTRAA